MHKSIAYPLLANELWSLLELARHPSVVFVRTFCAHFHSRANPVFLHVCVFRVFVDRILLLLIFGSLPRRTITFCLDRFVWFSTILTFHQKLLRVVAYLCVSFLAISLCKLLAPLCGNWFDIISKVR